MADCSDIIQSGEIVKQSLHIPVIYLLCFSHSKCWLTVTYFKLDSVLIIVMKPADLFLSPECKRMYFTSTGAHLRWCLRCCYRTAYFLLPCYCMHKENVCEGDLHSCLTHLSETELTAHVHV